MIDNDPGEQDHHKIPDPIGAPGVALARLTSPLQQPAQSIESLVTAANAIAWTSMVPQNYCGKPNEIVVAGLTGAELGWPLMASLRFIYVVNGKPGFAAEGLNALIRSAGHHLEIIMGNSGCRIVAERGPGPGQGQTFEYEFTLEDAARAGLLEPKYNKAGEEVMTPWKGYPANMCFARCLSTVARVLFPDLMMGVSYTPEEIDSFQSAANAEQVGVVRNDVDYEAFAANLHELYQALPEAQQERVDKWLKSLRLPDSQDPAYPNGMADISADVNHGLLDKLNVNLHRAAGEQAPDDGEGEVLETDPDGPDDEEAEEPGVEEAEVVEEAEIVVAPGTEAVIGVGALEEPAVDEDLRDRVYTAMCAMPGTVTPADLSGPLKASPRAVLAVMQVLCQLGNLVEVSANAFCLAPIATDAGQGES